MSVRRLQDVFKTSCKNVFKRSSRRLARKSSRLLQNVFKTTCKNFFNTSSRRLQDLLQRYLQDVFKIYRQVKLFLLTSLLEKYCKDGLLQKDLPRSHFWETYGQCTKFPRVIKISQVLVFYFNIPLCSTSFSGVLTEVYLESGPTSTMEFFLRKC